MVLPEKDRRDLHTAVVDYLRLHGMESAAAAVEAAVEAHGPFQDRQSTLETKWTTLIRLNRSLTAAEQKVRQLTQENEVLRDPTKRAAEAVNAVPREPAKAQFLGHRDTIHAVAFSPVDQVAYSASEDGTVRTWDLATKSCTGTIRCNEGVASLAVEPTLGRLLAVGCGDSAVRVYEDGEARVTLHGHDLPAASLVWAPAGGATLISGGKDASVRVWDAKRGAAVCMRQHDDGMVRSLAVSESGLVAAAIDTMVHLLRLGPSELTPVRRVGPFTHILQAVALSNRLADGVLVESFGTAEQKAAAKAEAKLRQKGEAVTPRDPLYLAAAGRERDVTLFDAASGAPVHTMADHESWVRQVAFSPNGKHLLSCSDDCSIRALDLGTRRPAAVIADAHEHFVTCLAPHPTLPLLITGSAKADVKVWGCGV